MFLKFNFLGLTAFHLTGNSLYPSKGQFWNPCLIQNPSPCFPWLPFFRFSAFRLHNYVCSASLGPFFDLHINAHDTSVSPFSDFLLFFLLFLFIFFFLNNACASLSRWSTLWILRIKMQIKVKLARALNDWQNFEKKKTMEWS